MEEPFVKSWNTCDVPRFPHLGTGQVSLWNVTRACSASPAQGLSSAPTSWCGHRQQAVVFDVQVSWGGVGGHQGGKRGGRGTFQ